MIRYGNIDVSNGLLVYKYKRKWYQLNELGVTVRLLLVLIFGGYKSRPLQIAVFLAVRLMLYIWKICWPC